MDVTTLIHDHHIQELTVSAEHRRIRVRTAFPGRTGPQFATVVFEDVQAYVLRGDALGTILFGIKKTDPIELYREYAGQMQTAWANAGGHAAWVESESSAAAFLSAHGIHGYRISSSIGLEGAVWARRLGRPSQGLASHLTRVAPSWWHKTRACSGTGELFARTYGRKSLRI